MVIFLLVGKHIGMCVCLGGAIAQDGFYFVPRREVIPYRPRVMDQYFDPETDGFWLPTTEYVDMETFLAGAATGGVSLAQSFKEVN